MSSIRREDLAALPGISPRLIRAFEIQAQQVDDSASTLASNIDATQGIANATVITLSPNDAFANERVLAFGQGLYAEDKDGNLTIRLSSYIKTNGGYRCTFNLLADTNLTLPTAGKVATTIFPGPYSGDAEAGANGVAIGEAYRLTPPTMGQATIAWRVT